jgi:pimeloyl-ACP methyl ester carboxylesterase
MKPLSINRKGEGPTLLFIHALGSSARVWERAVKLLSRSFHCCTLDLFGHGGNREIPDVINIEQTAGALAESLSEVKWKPAAIIGHNLGGLIGIDLVLKIPLCTDRLILIDTPTRQVRTPFLKKIVLTTLNKNFDQAVKKQFSRMTKDEEIYQSLVETALSTDRHAYLSYMDSMMQTDCRASMRTIDVPVDSWITRSLAPNTMTFEKVLSQYGYDHLPDQNRHHDPGLGHFMMLEKPAVFTQTLEKIVRGG